MDELLTWAPRDILGDFRCVTSSLKLHERLATIAQWYENGGVLIVGYEMFRMLIKNKQTRNGIPLADEEHKRVQQELLEGPTIIIADEAHKMKNATASLTEAANRFKSSSRIALTGSPLANNVEEYHTMIDWVAPNYLGPVKEFRAKYVVPIQDGLWQDSLSSDRRKALKMLGVLREDIAPKVHRADISVLRNDLHPKTEFVITVPLTDLQKKAYSLYVKSMSSGKDHARTKDGEITQSTLWHWLAILLLICNHPHCFYQKLNERKGDAKMEAARAGFSHPDSRDPADNEEAPAQLPDNPNLKVGASQQLIQEEMSLFQAEGADIQSIQSSNKVKILCQILDASRDVGDKVLVFSQSIPTLNFLQEVFIEQNRKFCRLDGKTKMSTRQTLIKDFNAGTDEVYLISTTAGGLGLNLYGANRVVIFDFKFNPIMEEQAVGRAFRIGQKKETFVYRFVAGGTFEETVHNKTIYKTQLASRVVDKKSPIAHAKNSVSEFLFEPKEVEQKDLSEMKGMDPKVLDYILASQKDDSTIRAIVKTDTFERDDDDKLTAEEQKEVDRILGDNQLERSDPLAFKRLLAKREQRASRPAPQVQAPQVANPALQNQGPSTPVNGARPGSSHAGPSRPANIPNGSAGGQNRSSLPSSKVNGVAPNPGIKPGSSAPRPGPPPSRKVTGPNGAVGGVETAIGSPQMKPRTPAPRETASPERPAIALQSKPVTSSGDPSATARRPSPNATATSVPAGAANPAAQVTATPTTPSNSFSLTEKPAILPPTNPVAGSAGPPTRAPKVQSHPTSNSRDIPTAESPAIKPLPKAHAASIESAGMKLSEKSHLPVVAGASAPVQGRAPDFDLKTNGNVSKQDASTSNMVRSKRKVS